MEAQNAFIKGMRWGVDYQIYITLSNDSNYVYDISALHHAANPSENDNNYVYYPVNLDPDFIAALKNKKLDNKPQPVIPGSAEKSKTLWSALHEYLGGGRVHFINCLLYAFETGNLSLTAPLMQRPVTNWKPNPVTQTYLRTKKWKYYAPVTQKEARKEYKIRLKENNLRELDGIPAASIQLFLATNDKQYGQLLLNHRYADLAKIELVKLMLGAPYLGQTQIDYIQGCVVKAVMQYSVNNLPSIIIFDEFKAAVAMTLDEEGYKIERIEFADYDALSFADAEQRREKIKSVISGINHANRQLLENNLKRYYK